MTDVFDAPTIPGVIEPRSLNDYFEVMTRAVFQAGVSWAQIARHWNAYRNAFAGFDVERVAQFGPIEMEQVLEEPGVLRMRRKVDGVIKNAKALVELRNQFGSFHDYAGSFDSYEKLAKDIKKRFSFMGDMNAWYLLFRTGEPVPQFETWVTTIPGDHPRMKEMVENARSAGRSSEYRI